MAVGKSAGRVSIRVYPDTTKFRADTREGVDKALAGYHPKVTLELEISEASKRAVEDEIDKLSKDRKVELKADLDKKLATAQIAAVSRNRFVDLTVRVTKSSLARAGSILAALSGGRAVANILEDLGRGLSNLDKSIPKLAAIALAVTNIGAAAFASVGGLTTLGAGVLQLVGLAGALPGVLGGGIVGMVTLMVAIKGVGDRLNSLKPAFAGFQKAIAGSFWDQATGPIKEMINTLLPRFQQGMKDVAFQLGSFTADFATALRRGLSSNAISSMMANLAHAIAIASGALQPLVTAFTMLGVAGAKYLPGLARSFDDIAGRFSSFVERITSDGSLDRWVADGLTALHQLGSVITSTASILAGLFHAANAAGGGGLATFAAVLAQVAAVVNSPGFQTAMTTIFAGAAAGVQALASAIGPIGGLFSALAGTIATVMQIAGQTVGTVLGQIATALSSPAFSTGLVSFFAGINAGISALAPALPAIVTLLGMLGQVAGTLAGQIGSVLGAALQALAPMVTVLLAAVQPLIPILGQALVTAITTLAPLFMQLVQALAGGLAPIIAQLVPLFLQLLPVITQILTAVIPLVPSILQIAAGLLQFLNIILQVTPIVAQFSGALQFLLATAQIVLGTLGALFSGNFSAIGGIVEAAGQRLIAAVDQMTGGMFSRFVGFVAQMIGTAAGWVLGMYLRIVSGLNNIRNAFNAGLQAIGAIFAAGWQRLHTAAEVGVGLLVASVRTFPQRARAALGNIGSYLYSAGADLVRGFINGMASMIGQIASKAASMAKSALDAAKGALGIGSPSKVFRNEVGAMIPAGIMVGIDSRRKALNEQIAGLVQTPAVGNLARAPLDTGALTSPASAGGLTLSNNIFHGIDVNSIAEAVLRLIDERQALEPLYGVG